MEQEELEKDLLEVETPSEPVEDSLGLEDLPEVRKWTQSAWVYKLVQVG